MDKYVYMIGIDPDYWTTDDDKACEHYKVDCKGHYKLGTEEGFILVGTLKNLKKLLEDYFGVAIVDEYLTEYDYFDFEDGDWIIGGWNESKTSVRKSLKESISDDDIIFKVATTMKEVSNLRLDREFDYMFDKKTLCDMIWYICDELDTDYKFHLYPKYDHGTQIRVDFIRDSVNVGWMAFDVMIKDTYPLTLEIESMLKK